MIDRLRLVRYKGFNEFTLHIKNDSILVGPNNAGKTTIIGALRLCAFAIRQARARKPPLGFYDKTRDRRVMGYLLDLPATEFVQENIRHEFRDLETRLELRFSSKATFYAIWPIGEEPFFYLEHVPGMQPKTPRVIQDHYDAIGIVPTLAPVDHSESMLSEKHVRDNLTTRLVSRHFRNQLYWLKLREPGKYYELLDFIIANTPELDDIELAQSTAGGPPELDLYYRESATRSLREIFWSGDGLQIWVQILFHIWRQREMTTIVLDEPDVFLHPDLQRRLLRVLEEIEAQVVMATHSPEILAEANRETVVVVDRTRKSSRRIDDERALASLNDALGSGFNLRLAKALRSRVALFVEGNDMKILRNIARVLGATKVCSEQGLSVVSMEGYSNKGMSSAFGWLNNTFLGKSVDVFVILDRDYRDEEVIQSTVNDLESNGVHAHVWRRKELESYLIVPTLIARVSGLGIDVVEEFVRDEIDSMRHFVSARCLAEKNSSTRSSNDHQVTVNERFMNDFDERWRDEAWRLSRVPAKEVLSRVNQKIQDVGGKAVSARVLSSRIRPDEVAQEMRDVISGIEDILNGSTDVFAAPY